MIEGVSLRNPVFVNTLGHALGLVLFGVLIALLLRGRNQAASRQRTASLLASGLAFLWNLGSLLGLGLTHGDGQVNSWLVAANFSALSLLPAVLLAVVLKKRYPRITWSGYALAALAVALHFAELAFPSIFLHEAALLLVTAGFGVLIGVVACVRSLRHDFRTSLTDLLCLFLFTLSFLHFGYGHSQLAWTNEVAWHHAGIPLVLIVILRDYRLLLLETFIRFLVNVGLTVVGDGVLLGRGERPWVRAGPRQRILCSVPADLVLLLTDAVCLRARASAEVDNARHFSARGYQPAREKDFAGCLGKPQ